MDVDNESPEWHDIDWDLLADDGGDSIEPPESGYGPGRGPKRRKYPPEPVSHTLTAVICGIGLLFSGLFLTTMYVSQTGGGIAAAYALSFSIALLFLLTFYIGSLWVASRRGVLEASLNRRAKPSAPDRPEPIGPAQPPRQ